MDYGHTRENQEQGFFTEGAGTQSTEVNNFEPENNLDLDNSVASWGAVPDRNSRDVGNKAIASAKESLQTLNSASSRGELGLVTDLSTPSQRSAEDKAHMPSTYSSIDNQALSADVAEIKTEEHLNASGIAKMDAVINDFEKTGDAATFYESAREMMEINIDSSYGRKLAAWAI